MAQVMKQSNKARFVKLQSVQRANQNPKINTRKKHNLKNTKRKHDNEHIHKVK